MYNKEIRIHGTECFWNHPYIFKTDFTCMFNLVLYGFFDASYSIYTLLQAGATKLKIKQNKKHRTPMYSLQIVQSRYLFNLICMTEPNFIYLDISSIGLGFFMIGTIICSDFLFLDFTSFPDAVLRIYNIQK